MSVGRKWSNSEMGTFHKTFISSVIKLRKMVSILISYSVCQQTEIQVEFIIPVDQQLIVLTGVVLGLLFLIILTVIMWKVRVDFQIRGFHCEPLKYYMRTNLCRHTCRTVSWTLWTESGTFTWWYSVIWSDHCSCLSQDGVFQEEEAAWYWGKRISSV